jgi:hypothetical protein
MIMGGAFGSLAGSMTLMGVIGAGLVGAVVGGIGLPVLAIGGFFLGKAAIKAGQEIFPWIAIIGAGFVDALRVTPFKRLFGSEKEQTPPATQTLAAKPDLTDKSAQSGFNKEAAPKPETPAAAPKAPTPPQPK